METVSRHGEPFAPRRWLVRGLPQGRGCGQRQRKRGRLTATAALLALLTCYGGVATARDAGERTGAGRVVAALGGLPPCVGDCHRDGAVTVDEILWLTNIALGEADIATCGEGDVNADGQITIDEIIAAVTSALNGCAPPATSTPTPVATSTATATLSPTAPATLTPTASPTQTNSPTPTSTIAPTGTPTPTIAQSRGPLITYFGLAGQDRGPLPTATPRMDEQTNLPIFSDPPNANGRGFYIIVEAGLGPSGAPPATMTSNSDPAGRPDLQIQADRDLGDGSKLVCDARPIGPVPSPTITPGGVPGINSSTTEQDVTDALNDFGCRFTVRQSTDDAITEPTPGIPRFVNRTASLLQFAFVEPIGPELALHEGDTVLTVRVRDTAGNVGDPKSIVLRVPTPSSGGATARLGP